MRAAIVSRQHLAGICEQLGWGEQLVLSPQLEKSGGRKTLSILANTFESVIGAVMMDSNYNAARKVSLALLEKSLDDAQNLIEVNSKGCLLETLQAINCQGPEYDVKPVSPEQPAGPFSARVLWNGMELGCGQGSSKRRAQIAAAAQALQLRLWEGK